MPPPHSHPEYADDRTCPGRSTPFSPLGPLPLPILDPAGRGVVGWEGVAGWTDEHPMNEAPLRNPPLSLPPITPPASDLPQLCSPNHAAGARLIRSPRVRNLQGQILPQVGRGMHFPARIHPARAQILQAEQPSSSGQDNLMVGRIDYPDLNVPPLLF